MCDEQRHRESRTWEPHVEEVIITHELRGSGMPDDHYRRILTVWTLDGEKLAEAADPQSPRRNT
jgi:hypothetical protein